MKIKNKFVNPLFNYFLPFKDYFEYLFIELILLFLFYLFFKLTAKRFRRQVGLKRYLGGRTKKFPPLAVFKISRRYSGWKSGFLIPAVLLLAILGLFSISWSSQAASMETSPSSSAFFDLAGNLRERINSVNDFFTPAPKRANNLNAPGVGPWVRGFSDRFSSARENQALILGEQTKKESVSEAPSSPSTIGKLLLAFFKYLLKIILGLGLVFAVIKLVIRIYRKRGAERKSRENSLPASFSRSIKVNSHEAKTLSMGLLNRLVRRGFGEGGINFQRPTKYFIFALLFLFILLKFSIISILPETIALLVTLAPLVVILAMSILAFQKSRQNQPCSHLLPLTLKFLLVIFVFYLFYSPGSFLPILLVGLKFFHDWDAGAFFVLLLYLSGLVIFSALAFLLFRLYQKSRGQYQGSLPRLIRNTLYTLFFIFLVFFGASAWTYPGAYSPLTGTLGDLLYTLSNGSILAFKGDDPLSYQRFNSLQDLSLNLRKSLKDSRASLTESLSQTQAEFLANLTDTRAEFQRSITASAADLKKTIETDISDKLSLAGGTISGDLVIKKSLTVNDTLEADTIDFGSNTITDGSFEGNWSFESAALSGIGTIDTGQGATEVYLMNQDVRTSDAVAFSTLDTGQGAYELYAMDQNLRLSDSPTFTAINTGQGAYELYAMNQNVLTVSAPAFSGLTLSGNLVLGANTLTTSNTGLVSNLNADLLDSHDSSYFQTALTNPVTGAGTINYLSKFTGTSALGNSLIYDNGINVGIGTTAPAGLLHVSSDTVDLGKGYFTQANASSDGFDFNFRKARGTGASPTVITTADQFGAINFTGYGGAAGYITGAAIKGISSGTIADSQVPGQLSFWTGTDAAPSVLTERMTILNSGNVGIGTTGPGAKLEIFSNAWEDILSINRSGENNWAFRISGTGDGLVLYPKGVDSTFSIRNNALSTSEIFSVNTANGTTLISGNVGIGTTAPGNILTLSPSSTGRIELRPLLAPSTTAAYQELQFSHQNGVSLGFLRMGYDTNATDDTKYTDLSLGATQANGRLRFWTNNSERMRVDENGNVGIGTTGPNLRLEVQPSERATAYSAGDLTTWSDQLIKNPTETLGAATGIAFMIDSSYNMNGASGIGVVKTHASYATDMVFITRGVGVASSEKMRIMSDGNVGIGTTGPGAKLEVKDGNIYVNRAGGVGDAVLDLDAYSNSYLSSVKFRRINNATYTGSINAIHSGTVASQALTFNVGSNAEVMRIMNGNVGIGTTNPLRKLEVNGSIRMGALIAGGGGAVAVYRDVNGDLADATSSLIYKKDISDLEPVLPQIMKLRPVRFKWNNKTSTPDMEDYGMIAEEVNQILPDLVTYNPDGVPHGLKYEKMGVFALKGLQEQELIISEQGTMIKALSGDTLSINDKISLIGQNLDRDALIITDLSNNLDSLKSNQEKQDAVIKQLEDQIQALIDQNQAIIDFSLALDTKNLLYKDSLGNINLLDGKITAKDIEALGELTAKKVKTENLEMSGGNTSGKAVIKAGQIKVLIATPKASKNVKIYITLTSSSLEKVLYVSEKDILENESFTVMFDGEAVDNDVTFSWLIVE